MGDRQLRAALADIRRDDPETAERADSVVQWVAGEEGVDAIDLSHVQRFAWYDLSVKWLTTDQDRRETLAAGAALFDALRLDRYASVMRSSQTSEILKAHERSYDEGLKAFQKAFDGSGINPPDLEDFEWSDMMASEENGAHMFVGRALERAIDDGRMVPGTSGWKTTARAITTGTLDSSHPAIPSQSWRSAILTERVEGRLHTLDGRSPELHAMLSATANRLLAPTPVPPDLELRLEPVTWFLNYVGERVKMTGAGYLPTAMVREAAERFRWDKGWSNDPPKKESDSKHLMTLHQLLLDSAAIRHRTGVVIRTKIGTRMLEDPPYMWRTLTASLTPDDWLAAVAQTYTLLLLSGEDDVDALCDHVRAIVIEYGYRFGDERPERLDVLSAWWRVSRPLDVLDGLKEVGRYPSRRIELTSFGEATLLERLRLDVTGPKRYP